MYFDILGIGDAFLHQEPPLLDGFSFLIAVMDINVHLKVFYVSEGHFSYPRCSSLGIFATEWVLLILV